MCLISDRTLAALKEIYRSYDEILSNEQMVNGHLSFWVFEGLSSPFNKGAPIIYVEQARGRGSPKCQLYYLNLCSKLFNKWRGRQKSFFAIYVCPLPPKTYTNDSRRIFRNSLNKQNIINGITYSKKIFLCVQYFKV